MKKVGLTIAMIVTMAPAAFGFQDECMVVDDCHPAISSSFATDYCVVDDRAVCVEPQFVPQDDCVDGSTVAAPVVPQQTVQQQSAEPKQTAGSHNPQPSIQSQPAQPAVVQNQVQQVQQQPVQPMPQYSAQPYYGSQQYASAVQQPMQQNGSYQTYQQQPYQSYQAAQPSFGASIGFGAPRASGGG